LWAKNLHFGLFLSTTSTMLGRKESVDVPKTFVAFLSLHGCLSGKGRLFRPLGITLGLWFGNLWLGIGMGMGMHLCSRVGIFGWGLGWVFGTWAWVWAGRHYLEIEGDDLVRWLDFSYLVISDGIAIACI
jgi:hypothetical protein